MYRTVSCIVQSYRQHMHKTLAGSTKHLVISRQSSELVGESDTNKHNMILIKSQMSFSQ